MSHARVVCSALGAGLLASCGGPPSQAIDAPPAPCWPLDAMPGGQAELGTGDLTFEPMPAMLPIVTDVSQSDPYLQIYARIRGIPPGNPGDILDPRNPHTKIGAAIDELGLTLGVECPASLGYVAAPEAGAFDLVHALRIGTGIIPVGQLAGKQTRITLEVVGSNGLYAQDMKLVTLTIPGAAR